MKLNGAQLVIKTLQRHGVDIVAGIPGGANLPLYDALGQSTLRHVLARHEQGAGFIAQGMARASGRPAVCFGTSGPGATNLLTAIADAKLDSIPLVAITAQVPRQMIGTDAFQEIDTYGLTLPITKHNFQVRSIAELVEVIPDGFRIATSGRPGPVAIDIPKDVLTDSIDIAALPEVARRDTPPRIECDHLRRAAQMINSAQRPIFLIGAGLIAAEASGDLLQLMEKASIPAAATLLGLGAIPNDHPLFAGMVGMHAARYTNLILEECDLLIGVGVRFDDRATGKAAEFCPRAQILHVDIDPSELGKIKNPALGIIGDAGEFIRAITPLVAAHPRREWNRHLEMLRARYPLMTPGRSDPLRPYGIIRYAAAALPRDAIIATDVGQHQMWVAQAFPFSYPRQFLTSGGLGTMGFGLPAAIGAALAKPDRTVVCFSGDGSLLMNLQELATAAEENVKVKIILLNNERLGLVRQQQQLFYGERFCASEFSAKTDFVAIACGFNVDAVDLGRVENPIDALAESLAAPGPCLIHVPIAAEENVFPMVPPGGANRDMIAGEAQR
ncbi:MAG TPA: acetolactate synthase large subunit [Methylomirabilota bacterium]|nr:acetolactate synthase large subunit [Methylomirabilota bacterium]